jgi:peroxiredoxin-like protein
MALKMNKPHLFSADVSWISDDRGIVHSPSIKQSVSVSTSPDFGGNGEEWNAETLFLSAVISCYMTTYLQFAKKIKFEHAGFECTATGQVDLVDGKYKFTYIHIYPKVYLTNEIDEAKAFLAMEKTRKYCLISNSINAEILYHPEAVIKNKKSKHAA